MSLRMQTLLPSSNLTKNVCQPLMKIGLTKMKCGRITWPWQGLNSQVCPYTKKVDCFSNIFKNKTPQSFIFVTGERDQVRCISCGIHLSEWKSGENPWKEHCKMQPNCSFVKCRKKVS